MVFDATRSAAGRAGHTCGQKGGDLGVENLALDCQQEGLGRLQCQTQLLRLVALLVQHDQFVDRHWLVIIGDNHEPKFEAQHHVGNPQRKDPATVSVPITSRRLAPPLCHALHRGGLPEWQLDG